MSLSEIIEIEQIEKAELRMEVLGLHKSPDKIKGRKGVDGKKSNSKKRHYSKNVTIKNNPDSNNFKSYYQKLQEKARLKDRY